MPRPLLALLLLALSFTPSLATPVSAQTGDFTIVLDVWGYNTSTVSGQLSNVPPGATSATVTVTLANGSQQSVTTSAAQNWKFDFGTLSSNGPWIQISALTSNGIGVSLPNNTGGGIASAAYGPYSGYGYGYPPFGGWGGYGYGGGYPFGGYGYGYGGYGGQSGGNVSAYGSYGGNSGNSNTYPDILPQIGNGCCPAYPGAFFIDYPYGFDFYGYGYGYGGYGGYGYPYGGYGYGYGYPYGYRYGYPYGYGWYYCR